MRYGAPHFRGRLVFPKPFIDDLAQEIVFRPGQGFDLGDQLGPYQDGEDVPDARPRNPR